MPDLSTITRPKIGETTEVRLAKRWRCLLHNDDIHTMDFVVSVLMEIFGMDTLAAHRVMLDAHNEGVSVCQTGMSQEHAELKADQLACYGLTSSIKAEP